MGYVSSANLTIFLRYLNQALRNLGQKKIYACWEKVETEIIVSLIPQTTVLEFLKDNYLSVNLSGEFFFEMLADIGNLANTNTDLPIVLLYNDNPTVFLKNQYEFSLCNQRAYIKFKNFPLEISSLQDAFLS